MDFNALKLLITTSTVTSRALTESEIVSLERSFNFSSDWSKVKLIGPSPETNDLAARIRHCEFDGEIYISTFSKSVSTYDNIKKSSGLHYSTFSGKCIIGNDCYISNSMCHNCFIEDEAIIMHCPHVAGIVGEGQTDISYGNGQTIIVGPENGDIKKGKARRVVIHMAATFTSMCRQALLDTSSVSYDSIEGSLTVVRSKAILYRCDIILNSLIGAGCKCVSSNISSCTLLGESITSSHLTTCILGLGCSANDCIAESTILVDHARLGEKARVSSSVLGPDSCVAGGECMHCILGPFVGFHHQSLLIATIWPLGRGNIAYGAKVGANHTGRVNDQECMPGEGMFFGLGCAVKFPFNAIESPYSVIAPSTVCQSQKISFPFSLISESGGNASTASSINVIRPAWILIHNPYLIERSNQKFVNRMKATSNYTSYPVLRPSVIELMIDAKKRLETAHMQSCYLGDKGIPGLGVCSLSLIDRIHAITAYGIYVRAYALMGLLDYCSIGKDVYDDKYPVVTNQRSSSKQVILDDLALFGKDESVVTEIIQKHRLHILQTEYEIDFKFLTEEQKDQYLDELVELTSKHAESVEKCRMKDEERGKYIIEDYVDAHKSAKEDDVVSAAWEHCKKVNNKVAYYKSRVKHSTTEDDSLDV